MKRELERKIKSMCDSIGTAAAAEKCTELTEKLGDDFDERIKAGMSELDAYRDVLKNIDEIQEILDSLPVTEEENNARKRKKSSKNLNKLLSKISSSCWLLVVLVYLLFSMTFGGWKFTWLIFLWGAIGQTILNMVKSYNNGKPLKKVLKGGMSEILWLATTILYFIFSFATGLWHISWMIYIVAAIVQIIMSAFLDD